MHYIKNKDIGSPNANEYAPIEAIETQDDVTVVAVRRLEVEGEHLQESLVPLDQDGPRATTVELAIYQAFQFDFDLTRAALLSVIQIAMGDR